MLVGMNVRVDGYLSLYVSPAMNWQLVRGVPLDKFHPKMLR